jgi:glycosyltransferase involved in cell wall biosynthesis
LVPNAVNIKHFSQNYSKERLDEFKKQIGKKEGGIFLISTSRLTPKNANDDVIKALAYLPENVKFVMSGEGPDLEKLERLSYEQKLPAVFLAPGKGSDREGFEKIVERNGWQDKVLFFAPTEEQRSRKYDFLARGGGPYLRKINELAEAQKIDAKIIIPPAGPKIEEAGEPLLNNDKFRTLFFVQTGQEEMPKHLKSCDIFIRPSLSEGLGNSFLEAMTAGIPVIGTNVGGIPDFLFDPEINPDKPPTGLFCNVRDPRSIARKIEMFLENDDLRERAVRNAKELAAKNYDWDLIAPKMKNIFNKLTQAKQL